MKQHDDTEPAQELMPSVRIRQIDCDFEREPLVRPFGFKGGYMTDIWQVAAMMEGGAGERTVGLGTQNVLWSDARVFADHTESGGNALMYTLTERALQMVEGEDFSNPVELLDGLWREVHAYGKEITRNPDLRETFALNALVAVDNAAWLLYAKENGITTFDEMIPEPYLPALSHRHRAVASVPAIGYASEPGEIEELVRRGHFVMKIKLGSPGTQKEMLEQDKRRLSEIHRLLGPLETEHTESGRVPYWFDANGRYENKETLGRLLDHARSVGALDQILVIEEPFPEDYLVDVSDVGVRIMADESAHTDEDVLERIQMGYGAIAVKAIAKTMSMTLKMAQAAHEHDVPCTCADLTVNPILVDWNLNVAARLAPLPGFDIGLMEANGHQHYLHWDRMESYRADARAEGRNASDSMFVLDDEFYRTSGGIFYPLPHYEATFDR